MNTNMTGFRWVFFKSLHPCVFDESYTSALEDLNSKLTEVQVYANVDMGCAKIDS